MTHPHADVLRAIADGVPLSEFEGAWKALPKNTGWQTLNANDIGWFLNGTNWLVRRKQQTRVVNGFTVPAPLDREPEEDALYYMAIPSTIDYFDAALWAGCSYDKRIFSRGLCFATKEAAVANAKAMIGIDPEAA